MKIRFSKSKAAPALTDDQRAAMTALGEDFESFLGPGKKHQNLGSFFEATKINILLLHKIKDGTLTGPAVTMGMIYVIADELGAEVRMTVPSEEWNHRTPLCAMWRMGATIRLVEK